MSTPPPPPTPSLRGAFLRFYRADRHLAEADEIVREYGRQLHPYVVAKHNDQGRYQGFEITGTPPLPEVLPVVVSDVVHNLRAALDYLVYELAFLDSSETQDNTQFLIEDVKSDPVNPKRGFDGRRKKHLVGLSDAHVAAIEALQPYRGVDWTKTLRDISNPDKHRHLTVLTDREAVWIFQGRIVSDLSAPPDGIRVGDLEFTVGAHDAIHIAPPDRERPSLMRTLRALQLEVCRTLEFFKPEFERFDG